MKKQSLGKSELMVPSIAVGCMRIDAMEDRQLDSYLAFCLENGLNFFDHADIYGKGLCETKFGQAVKRMGIQREDLILQSKCGIVPGIMYDFSKEHILKSVDDILKRLGTEYLDVLVLHRPDALAEPEEVAEAFNSLEDSGKVRHFGVSNHKPMQIELLKKAVKQPLLVNQLQLSLPFSTMIANGLEVNMQTDGAVDRDGSVLDYSRLNDMTIQAWSPFQYGFFEGVFIGNQDKFPELNQTLTELAEKYDTTPTAIATAWILRHPAKIQMIAGTTNQGRMEEIVNGSEIQLSREEWYRLYMSSGHILP
ncbi:aldo/keto reductase [Pradoshia eiseniae]|uniref:Aldo/keto reductase n=1 Tax=Pradoshia eiseniae TaxID=2064768 RepID=A0A2S7N451_9BACI|nr:aldo/keto reductase [Pradoshia eiseniae]PQD96755.1 aldo/keto reductase [Pradoshia eiseniae]